MDAPRQTTIHLRSGMAIFVGAIIFFSLSYPLLRHSSYLGSAELHVLMEISGAIIGLLAGLAFVTRFYALGNRFHLFIGLAFLINGAEDFVHGLFALAGTHDFTGQPIARLFQFVPGTYVSGRLMCAIMLLLAGLSKNKGSESADSRRETWLFSLLAIFTTIILTSIASTIPLPQFTYPDWFFPRPIDFISACFFFMALLLFGREYCRSEDSLTWWVFLAIGINVVGQVFMSFSRQFYDPFFDFAHLCKALGYLLPLVGFFLYQIKIIVAHKETEEVQKALTTRLSESQRIAHIGSWEHNLETNQAFWSEELFRLFGFDPEKEREDFDLFFSMVHPEDQPLLKKCIEETLQLQRPFHIDYRFIRGDGSLRYIRAIAELIPDSSGELVILSGTGQDITKRKQAEIAAGENNRFLKSLVDLHPDILYIYDLKGQSNVYSNEGIKRILGYSSEEIQALGGECLSALMHPDDFKIYNEKILSQYAAAKDADQIVNLYRMRHKLGEWRWLESREIIYQRDPQGNPSQVFGVCSDVTAQRQAQEKIRQSEEFIRAIHDSVDEGFIVVDRNFRILSTNRAYCQQIGMAIEQVVGQPCFKISHNRERPCYEAGEECAVKEVFEFGEPRTIMHKHQGEEGVLYVETKAYPMMDGSGVITAAIEVIHNVTERYLLEAEQLKTQKLEAIGTLAGGIAHDFNNLLQGVFGYLSVAKMFAKQPEKLVEILEQAEEAMALSVNLTTQLLTFAKGGNPSKQKLNLKPLIENATKFALSGSRCGHQLHLAPDLWLVEVDKGQISQVVQNIVLNASEAMPEGGVVEILSENLNLPQGGRRIRIVIKDTGIGIPASHRAKIFDPYFTTKQKGSGLGLATSYSIVKNHGGSIEVGSAPSEGSTFSIILPACEPEVAVDEELQPAVLGSDQKWRLLLMDDEATVRDVAQSMLDMLGHDLQLACHGAEALGKYQEGMLAGKPFDLVILDLTIKGGMGGEETIKRLLEIDPKACVVVSSGYSDSLVVANYRDYGFKGILNKPYNLKGLQECLARVLG